MINNVLSCLGGYFKSKEFDLDITKAADLAEISEDEFSEELKVLAINGDINIDGNKITLVNIEPKICKKFNDLYMPVETMTWNKNTKLVLDK